MKKITTPHLPNQDAYVFTEGINYFSTGYGSIWGEEDPLAQQLLQQEVKPGSRWLNLAAGDGRYNNILLSLAGEVTVVDIDEGALSKLWYATPPELHAKLNVLPTNIVEPLPFDPGTFDGVFSTGTLHLFPAKILGQILRAVDTLIRPHGTILIDLAVDIKRRSPRNGALIAFGSEPLYSLAQAQELLPKLLPQYQCAFQVGKKIAEECLDANPPYIFECLPLYLIAHKK